MIQQNVAQLIDLLREQMPLNIEESVLVSRDRSGLIIVDAVQGFCAPGAGNLAPPSPDADTERMVRMIADAATAFCRQALPIFVLREEHVPGKIEHPYPPHCEKGTGEEDLMPEIEWLHDYKHATVLPKSCISGYVAAQQGDKNLLTDWVCRNELEDIVVVGICTDICVLQVVQPLLSARNIDSMPSLKRIVAYVSGCGTYDLPKQAAVAIGLPEFMAHPRGPTQHLGLYLMQMSGVTLAKNYSFATKID